MYYFRTNQQTYFHRFHFSNDLNCRWSPCRIYQHKRDNNCGSYGRPSHYLKSVSHGIMQSNGRTTAHTCFWLQYLECCVLLPVCWCCHHHYMCAHLIMLYSYTIAGRPGGMQSTHTTDPLIYSVQVHMFYKFHTNIVYRQIWITYSWYPKFPFPHFCRQHYAPHISQ